MNSMITRFLRPTAALFLCFSAASCGDDPELVRKREEQKSEILRLDSELKVLQEKIAEIPKDRTAELTKLQEESESQKATITALEDEIQDLQAQKARIEKDHEAYKQKYVVR